MLAPYQPVLSTLRRQPASNLVAAIVSCRLRIQENGCWHIPVFQENTSHSVDKAMLVFMTMTLWNTKTAVVACQSAESCLDFSLDEIHGFISAHFRQVCCVVRVGPRVWGVEMLTL